MPYIKTKLLSLCLCVGSSLAQPATPSSPLTGAWVDTRDSTYVIGIGADRYTTWIGGQVRWVSQILSLEGSALHLCEKGRTVVLETALGDGELTIHNRRTGEIHRLRRRQEWQASLEARPMPLPAPMPLRKDRILEIQGEIWRRSSIDQGAMIAQRNEKVDTAIPWLPPASNPGEVTHRDLNLLDVQAANTNFMKTLLAEVGWIDVARFGYPASSSAFFLVQHSYDLPMMMAVLEAVRRDIEAGHPMGEAYAYLWDRVHLMLGKKQRYGSQVDYDDLGQVMLKPVEEPDRLDERRKSLGMTPIAEYLRAFGAAQVRISPACSGQ